MLKDFKEISSKRYVRDGQIIITQDKNEFFTGYDWPTIEEIQAMSYQKDLRIALLTRDFFDYIDKFGNNLEALLKASPEEEAKPKDWNHVTYGSDVSELDIPFNLDYRQFLIYSGTIDGKKIFTINLGYLYTGNVNMTASSEKTGKVSMKHEEKELPKLVNKHILRLNGYRLNGAEFLTESTLCEKARETFDNIMYSSRHLI